jgi:hypothetical protein
MWSETSGCSLGKAGLGEGWLWSEPLKVGVSLVELYNTSTSEAQTCNLQDAKREPYHSFKFFIITI